MRILIPILGFAKSGGFRVLSQFANYWSKSGHEVSFLCSSNSINPYFPTEAKIIWFNDKNEIVDTNKFEKKKPLNVFIKQIALYKVLSKYANEYDIVLANHSLTALPVNMAKIKAKKFYYVQAFEPDYYVSRKTLIGKFLYHYSNYTYKLKNLDIIVNAPVYYSYKSIEANKYVPCGLDLEVYYPKNINAINFEKETIKIGAIGRVESFKGTTFVIEAFTKIKQNKLFNKKMELYLAFADIKTENHESSIFVLTPKSDSELADFYRSMDIIIAPAIGQFGAIHYPVIESMACGTPIITTYFMPAHEGNAWLVSPQNSDSIISQIESIISNSKIVKEKAYHAIYDIQQFNWSIIANKMISYFTAKES